ncbi:MAG: hypothetical protein J5639_08160 [Bacteroidales bacterium]|nr:hypothetical protein [Bacteroidales bacterium]
MKKCFILAAAALVAFTACTKMELDETSTPDVKIGFQVANYMSQTKADGSSFLAELTAMGATANAFKSSAFIHPYGSTFGPFFNPNPETITWNTSNTEWEPGKDYYWPKSPNSNIDFFSWYVFEGSDPTLTYASEGANPTLAWTDRTVAYKSDILFANIAWHQTANQKRNQLDEASGGVPTLFHHALAQVKFQAKIKEEKDKKADTKNSGKYTFFEVKLNNVAVSNVHKNGTLSLTATYQSTKTTTEWTLPANNIWADATTPVYVNTTTDWFTVAAATNTDPLTTTLVALNAATYMPDGFIAVRPQAVTDDMKLTFTMSITKWYGTEAQYAADGHDGCTNLGTEVFPVTDFATEATDDAYTDAGLQLNKITSAPAYWAMNQKIIYNIIIDPTTDTILFDPAVVDWDAATSYDVEVPKP